MLSRKAYSLVFFCFAAWSLEVASAQSADEFRAKVSPIFARQCVQCHNAKTSMAGLDLGSLRPGQNLAIWAKIRDRVQSRSMPPAPLPGLKETEAVEIVRFIDMLVPASPAPSAGPGRVTARRLNRTEYNNTIRDFLGVLTRPADVFPVDNQGYGFDNNGDVLTLSPMLMEKYMAAARSVSRIAVYGEAYEKKPGIIGKFMIKTVQDDGHVSGSVLPFSMRGTLEATFRAPVEADYVFQFRMLNRRGRAPGIRPRHPDPAVARELSRQAAPPIDFQIDVDGRMVKRETVIGEEAFDYTRGPTVAKVHLSPGEHKVHVYLPDHANLDNARANLNPDGRRQLGAEWMEVLGPYDPVAEKPASHKRIFVCATQDDNCARKILSGLALRGFRRPPSAAEVDRLLTLVGKVRAEGDSFEEGIRVALQSILVSPAFLFRIEADPPAATGAYQLGDFELASRLSYFLWGSMPDEQLLELAAQRRLAAPTVLEGQVRRMLRDPKSSNLVESFATQWLDLRAMDRKKPDAASFPNVDDELLSYMRKETLLFTGEIFREDRSLLDFIDGNFTYVNGPLARYYGIGGVDGFAFRRVSLDGTQRAGLVTQASILALTSYATRTSPVIRGKWVLQTLLGAAPPPPPADVPALEEKNLGSAASVRERLEQHRANPACAACHNAMDPIGFGLENFDAAGAWRTHEGKFPIDSSGVLPDGRTFQGAAGLRQILRSQSAQFTRNFTEQMLTYALGRGLESSDRGAVDKINQRLIADGNKLSALVLAIVESEPFRMRMKEDKVHAAR